VTIFLILLPIICGICVSVFVRVAVCKKRRILYDALINLRRFKQLKIQLYNMTSKDWNSNSELVLQTLTRMDTRMSAMETHISQIGIKIGKLEVKSGIYGLIGGALVALPTVIVFLLK
jgi:hypothetical protein